METVVDLGLASLKPDSDKAIQFCLAEHDYDVENMIPLVTPFLKEESDGEHLYLKIRLGSKSDVEKFKSVN